MTQCDSKVFHYHLCTHTCVHVQGVHVCVCMGSLGGIAMCVYVCIMYMHMCVMCVSGVGVACAMCVYVVNMCVRCMCVHVCCVCDM